MKTPGPRPQSVTQYIDAAPKEAQKKLREIRACIRKAAPGAKESLKWGMPAVSYKRILVTFAGFKKHIGFYPTPSAVKAFAKDLSKFATAKGSIQFPLDKPLPLLGQRSDRSVLAAQFLHQPGDRLLDAADLIITVGYDPVEYEPGLWNRGKKRDLIHIDTVLADIDKNSWTRRMG